QQKLRILSLILLASFLVLCCDGVVTSAAQSSQKEEREFEDRTPQHLPIKLKVKNLDKVKDLQNENWVEDLEIEVENKSDKPIYFLYFGIDMPDVRAEDNNVMGFSLSYGRDDLIDFTARLQSDDVPIKPGETCILKIAEAWQQGWRNFTKRRGISNAAVKKVRIIFQLL